jgi:membrane protein
MRKAWELVKETYTEWDRHQAPRLGAALAYYTVLSVAPLIIVVIAVIGLVFGRQAAEGQIMAQIQGLVGRTGAEAIQTVVANAYKPSSGIIATVIGLITLFAGASGAFAELHDSLNLIWEVAKKPEEGIRSMIRTRILSFGMVLAIGFVLLVSLVISAGISAAGAFMNHLLPIPAWILQAVNMSFSLIVFTGVFALIYKFLPDESITWRDTFFGAVFTSVLFTIGKYLIGLYLGQASVTSAYGAAGSLVIVLVWVYYSAQIFFFGAEFTHVFAIRRGSHMPAGAGQEVMTVPVKITNPPAARQPESRTGPTATRKQAAAGGPSLWLVAALGGMAWWRGRSNRRH